MAVGFESNSSHLVFELNRLHNQLKEKDMELGVAYTEIKALKAAQLLKDKALQELSNDLHKSHQKLALTEESRAKKNLEIKKIANGKKDALAAQFAAEATLRRLHANHKENDSHYYRSIESVIAPLEANLKTYKKEIAALQEDKKALVRMSWSKESALVEAERILESALERALVVEEVQDHNYELKKQIELCQEEKRILERELARVKVSVNRVAANKWKDENDKVMSVIQWFDERKLLKEEMRRIREKLAVLERTAKAEAQLNNKLKQRLKTSSMFQVKSIIMQHPAPPFSKGSV